MTKTSKVFALAAIVAAAAPAAAQEAVVVRRYGWGAQIALNLDASDLGIGGRFRYPFTLAGTTPLTATAELNWYPDDLFDLNWNLTYDFASRSQVNPYAGGGLNLTFGRGSDLGLNAVGGFLLGNLGQLKPYIEGRFVFFNFNGLIVTAGVQF